MGSIVKIGTRGSQLALWQANWVANAITSHHPETTVQMEIIKTRGDKIQDVPLNQIGGKALFIKEIEDALLNHRIDIAVHSMKDMPANIPEGLCIGAVPEREMTKDALVSKKGIVFSELCSGARIGTGSIRRSALIKHARPDIHILPLRGNLDTRLKKLETEDMDAIVLAAAGLKRMGWEEKITEYLDEDVMLPAVGQGALCIEIRQDDAAMASIVKHMDHAKTRIAVTGERAFLTRLDGSCHVPIAALGQVNNDQLTIDGLVADVEGKTVIRDRLSGLISTSETIGASLAERLLTMGAAEILSY